MTPLVKGMVIEVAMSLSILVLMCLGVWQLVDIALWIIRAVAGGSP